MTESRLFRAASRQMYPITWTIELCQRRRFYLSFLFLAKSRERRVENNSKPLLEDNHLQIPPITKGMKYQHLALVSWKI